MQNSISNPFESGVNLADFFQQALTSVSHDKATAEIALAHAVSHYNAMMGALRRQERALLNDVLHLGDESQVMRALFCFPQMVVKSPGLSALFSEALSRRLSKLNFSLDIDGAVARVSLCPASLNDFDPASCVEGMQYLLPLLPRAQDGMLEFSLPARRNSRRTNPSSDDRRYLCRVAADACSACVCNASDLHPLTIINGPDALSLIVEYINTEFMAEYKDALGLEVIGLQG